MSTEAGIEDKVDAGGKSWQLHRAKESKPRSYSFYTGLEL